MEPQTNAPTIDQKTREFIEDRMRTYAQAKDQEKSAVKLKKGIAEEVLPLFLAYGLKDHTLPGVGKMVQKTSSGSRIDPEKLKIALLSRGVYPPHIKDAIDEATKSWETPYLDLVSTK